MWNTVILFFNNLVIFFKGKLDQSDTDMDTVVAGACRMAVAWACRSWAVAWAWACRSWAVCRL